MIDVLKRILVKEDKNIKMKIHIFVFKPAIINIFKLTLDRLQFALSYRELSPDYAVSINVCRAF